MITFENYLLFVAASILLCIVPGPDMIYLLSRSLAQGKKTGILAATGINLGGYFHLFAAILGISTILATSSLAFTIVKWAGAIYLIYLGVQAILTSGSGFSINTSGVAKQSGKAIFWQGFLSDALNPKVAIFFVALLPQFINTDGGNYITQLLVLGFTVNVIALTINICLVFCTSSLTKKLRQSNKMEIWLRRAMGTIFISLGLRLANEKL